MRILGIDPGLRITGYGCIDTNAYQPFADPAVIEAGVIRLDTETPIPARLSELHRDLTQIIKQITPDRIVVEKLFAHYAHPTTAIKMGHARGVILLAAQQHEIEIVEYSATEVKKAVVGNGHADKHQMQLAIQAICKLAELPAPSDVADALAIAVTGARHRDPSQRARS